MLVALFAVLLFVWPRIVSVCLGLLACICVVDFLLHARGHQGLQVLQLQAAWLDN
jgi:hypothetical protein